jgi:hypothetical protein
VLTGALCNHRRRVGRELQDQTILPSSGT